MKTINVKQLVQQAVGQEWPAFVAAHPNLAAILDETLLVEEATAKLSDDPAYQRALADAQAAGQSAQVIADLVQRFVKRWMGDLL